MDGFVIMKPCELEMSCEIFFRFDHIIMCPCIYLSFFLF
jgi:hypothetical protein